MRYYAREHTDPAGGALTITTDHQGAWITATEGRDEVTVGPFPVAVLELAGSYTRTDEPVDPDGDDTRTREHLLAEEHRLLGLEKALRAHLSRTVNRAEKAEQERDEARGALRARLGVLAVPRALTPDAITDEMVERARDAQVGATGMRSVPGAMRAILTAALTEPPTRPEGAEDWEDWLIEAMPHESMPDEDIALLADRIAARLAAELS